MLHMGTIISLMSALIMGGGTPTQAVVTEAPVIII